MSFRSSIDRYSKANDSQITTFEELKCECGQDAFELYSDDTEGGAYIVCSACKKEYDIENSKQYIEEVERNVCHCGNEHLKIGLGKSYYPQSTDIKWLYVGGSCDDCDLSGVYVDWLER